MNRNFKPPADPRGGHMRLYWELVDSNAWRCLSASDQRAYIALVRHLRSTNNGDLSLPLSVAKQWGIKSPATLAKSLRALCAVGLVAVTRKGGCTRGGQRLCTLYRLTDHPAYENPGKHLRAYKATNDWKAITTLAIGRAAIRDVELAAKEEAETKKTLVQKLAVTASKNELVKPLTASISEAWTGLSPQTLKQAKQVEQAANPMLARAGVG